MHKADRPKYTLYGYTSQEQLDADRGADDVLGADTLKEAKSKAKYVMTDEYLNVIESTTPVTIVQIYRGTQEDGGECIDELRA